MTYKPRRDGVLIQPQAREQERGGLIIPETASVKTDRGTVIAVGPGRTLDDGSVWPVAVQPGDVVLYGRYAGTTVGDDDLVIVREPDIFAVLESEVAVA